MHARLDAAALTLVIKCPLCSRHDGADVYHHWPLPALLAAIRERRAVAWAGEEG